MEDLTKHLHKISSIIKAQYLAAPTEGVTIEMFSKVLDKAVEEILFDCENIDDLKSKVVANSSALYHMYNPRMR